MSEQLVVIDKSILSEISDSIIGTVIKKNTDYGDAWQSCGPFTALVNLKHKLLRIENLGGGKESLVTSENVKDTLVDIIGYALLLLAYDKQKGL